MEGDGTFLPGDTCLLKATPQKGYKFIGWSENGKVVSTRKEWVFAVAKHRLVQAVFMKNEPDIKPGKKPGSQEIFPTKPSQQKPSQKKKP